MSDRLYDPSKRRPVSRYYELSDMIPLEDLENRDQKRLVVGHNVAYDRTRIKEQYFDQVYGVSSAFV